MESDLKSVRAVHGAPAGHWVGDGFPVRSLLSLATHGPETSPFLMLDYAGPQTFAPTAQRRGVSEHPHRGFETVTIVRQGELEHRDSTGAGGIIGPGDVQWMTAGAGIVHEEFHSPGFAQDGGVLEMVQIWVNLPAADKDAPPAYQSLRSADIPVVDIADGAGRLRVIAGAYAGVPGAARTFTPMHVWDLQWRRAGQAAFELPEGWTALLVVLTGSVLINGEVVAREAEVVELERVGAAVRIEANHEASLLVLAGEPIDEPVVAWGPFVMNSEEGIRQAVADFRAGRYGRPGGSSA